ncbi:MAG: lipoate--protein ligase family protein [Prevotella sp.]|nr:lipoate--protein ligase family protein [Prevotella sp.]
MTYLKLPTDETQRLSFFLAMEEYVARSLPPADYFFMWQVEPSVIFGRNQQLESEVNVDYCRQHGIRLYRRKSGGGCVYADQSNLMLSYITADDQVGVVFHRFINMILLVLRKLGLQATSTAHNDVLIDGRKVSGTAFYHLPDRSIVHGTLLYDTCMEHMSGAITPSREKLQQKGIQSVRQRITLLKDHVTQSLDEVKALIRQTLCSDELTLSPTDVLAIKQLEQQYLQESFIHLI